MSSTEQLPKKRNVIPKEVWAAIEDGCRSNIPLGELATKYCVLEKTIQIQASRKGWLVPRKIADEVARQLENAPSSTISEKKPSAPARRRDWVEAASEYRNMIMDKLEVAVQGMNLESPKTWRDAEIADRMARKAVGLESGETTVVQTIIPIGKGDFGVERDVTPSAPA